MGRQRNLGGAPTVEFLLISSTFYRAKLVFGLCDKKSSTIRFIGLVFLVKFQVDVTIR